MGVRDWTKSTLGERVNEAMRLGGLAAVDLANTTTLAQGTISRVRHDKRPTAEKRAGDTIAKIAAATRVDPSWLARGLGEPRPPAASQVAADHAYPSKIPAAAAMRGLVADEAIDAMMSEQHRGSGEDPGPEFWMQRARWWHVERERLRADLEQPSALDEAPTLAPRPKSGRAKR